MTRKPPPETLCHFFDRNSDGTWTTTRAVVITNGGLSTGLGGRANPEAR